MPTDQSNIANGNGQKEGKKEARNGPSKLSLIIEVNAFTMPKALARTDYGE